MVITLYHSPISGPSRGALLAAKVVGVDVNVKIVNLFEYEHLTEDFLKINPQHTVPAIVDGDLAICDSHAIACYLATAYGKDDTLYPKDPKKKAFVDQRLNFNCGTLFPRMKAICFPIFVLGKNQILYEDKTSLNEALGFLDIFLEGNEYICGENLTIADCVIVASISSLIAMGWNFSAYTNISRWVTKCASTIRDYAEANQKGADIFGNAIKSKLAPGQL